MNTTATTSSTTTPLSWLVAIAVLGFGVQLGITACGAESAPDPVAPAGHVGAGPVGSADALERRLSAPSGSSIGSADAVERRLAKKVTKRQPCFLSADAAERHGPTACRA